MIDFLNPKNWPPLADFAVFSLITGFLIWKTARAFAEKKANRWPADALDSLAESKDLRSTNDILKEKLRAAHAELELKQAKIDSLRAEK